MENITLGQIGVALTFIAGLLTTIGYLRSRMKSWVKDAIGEDLQALNQKIEGLNDKVGEVDKSACKNFLVARLSEVEQGQTWDEIERERFYECYQHYKEIGGNSYVDAKVKKLQAENRI